MSTAHASNGEGGTAASPPSDSVESPETGEVTLQPSVVSSETSVDAGRGKTLKVTLLPPNDGKRALKAWVWRFVSRFSPSINNKNVVCMVKKIDGTTCSHLMRWTAAVGTKKGTGTSGLNNHIQKVHTSTYEEVIKELGTTAQRKEPVAVAIGEKMNSNFCVRMLEKVLGKVKSNGG